MVGPFECVDGFTPFINDEPFDKPMQFTEGETVNVEWRKDGYKIIQKSFVAGEATEAAQISAKEYERFVDPSVIALYDKATKDPVTGARIHIQGKLMHKSGVYVPEYQFDKAEIFIDHTDYESVRLQNQNLNNSISVFMETKMFAYNFRIKLKSGDDLDFRVPSKVIMMESPLNGYKSANGTRPMLDTTNRLVYKPLDNTAVKRIVALSMIALLIGLIIGAGVMFAVGKLTTVFEPSGAVTSTALEQTDRAVQTEVAVTEVKEEKAQETKVEEPKVETAKVEETKPVEAKPAESKPVDVNVMSAVRYLEDNDVWNRAAMEEHTALKGLWDALNTRAFKKILDKKYDSLAGSAKFKRLRTAAKGVGTRQWPSSTYTSIGDEDITIDPYISKLERLLAPAN